MNINDLLRFPGLERTLAEADKHRRMIEGLSGIHKLTQSLLRPTASELAYAAAMRSSELQARITMVDSLTRPSIDAIAGVQSELLSLTQHVSQLDRHLQSATQTLVDDLLQKSALTATDWLIRIPSQSIFDSLPDLSSLIPRWAAFREEVSTAPSAGYEFALEMLPEGFFDSMEETDGRVRDAVITRKVVHQVNRSGLLNRLTDTCGQSRVLSRRVNAVKAAQSAHERREYLLSIPVLFAQVEGVYTDLLILKGEACQQGAKVRAAKNRKVIKDKAGKDRHLNGLRQKIDHSSFRLHPMTQAVAEFLVDHVSGRRNAVLHGQDSRYGSAKTSVKLILALASLAQVVMDFESGKITL